MDKTFKMMKTVVLLSTFSLYWQSSSQAIEWLFAAEAPAMNQPMQQIELNREIEACETEQPVQQVDCQKDEGISFERSLYEAKDPIFQYFIIRDQNILLSLSAVCTTSHKAMMWRYEDVSTRAHHYPWQDIDLYPSTLYVFNTRMVTILGLYTNIKRYGHDLMAGDIDRIRFEQLCAQFMQNPPFATTAVPVMYVELLQLDLSCARPTPTQALSMTYLKLSYEAKEKAIGPILSNIFLKRNPKFQNESALYCHSQWFVLDELFTIFSITLSQLDGSLMWVINRTLLDLKSTKDLTNTGQFSDTWKQIIDLEPVPTICQLRNAGFSHYNEGKSAEDADVKLVNFVQSAKYFEDSLEAHKAAGQIPTANNYKDIGTAYFMVGKYVEDPIDKDANLNAAAAYFNTALELGLDEETTHTVRERLAKITSYFQNSNKKKGGSCIIS